MSGTPSKAELLESAAFRLAEDDRYMASAFAVWGGGRLELSKIAETLGCGLAEVARLALCRRPPGRSVNFLHEVRRIATAVGVSEFPLAALLREADALTAFHNKDGQIGGLLAAARDSIGGNRSGTPDE